MPVVLVVEQDASYAQRIAAALRAMGHDVDLVADTESATRQANVRRPQLVVVSGSLPGAEATLGRFSQRHGGPGSLVMAPLAQAGHVSAEQFQADLLLFKPFSEDDLRQAVGRLLSRSVAAAPGAAPPARAPMPPPPVPAAGPPAGAPATPPQAATPKPAAPNPSGNPLTSAEIFGDVLAEVEKEAQHSEARPNPPRASTPPPSGPSTPASGEPSGARPSTPAARPARPKSRAGDDIDRKLERTLSGVLPDKLRRADKPRPSKRRTKPTDDDIDSLLDKTLSSLELPRKARRAKATAPKAGSPPAAPTTTPPTSAPVTPRAEMPTPASTASAAAAPPSPGPATTPSASEPAPTAVPSTPPPSSVGPVAEPASPPPPPTEIPPSAPPTQDVAPSFEPPRFEPPEIPELEVEPPAAEAFELPPTEPAIPPAARTPPPSPADETPPAMSFEPPSFDFEPPTAEPVTPTPTADATSAVPDEAPTGWSVTSFEDVETPDADLPSPFATELVPSIPDSPQRRGFDDETFADVEYPSDFAAAFAPAPEPDTTAGEDTGAALDRVLEVRGAAEAQDEGTPFGDYRLLDRVAVGGMAEVWRARRRGVEGFQKTVAIKRILYHLTGNDDFVTMFIDEAKLAAQLHHAHIVQIYDLGKVDDDFFIAMEYVDGKDLRTILNQAEQRGERLPLRLALEIVLAVARALDYAHRKKDENDRDLGLVHRDVSPQNVLIGYESEIKLCDFGIVKAVVKASTTQMGALKGKLQYMSPEQAWGREVDSRSDIFSLGSLCYEVLTGQRLFTGDSEIGVLDAVREGKVRSPRDLDPEIPASIEEITLKALASDPDARYQTAGEMARDLDAALDALGPAPTTLGEFLDTLFPRASTSGVRDVATAEPPASETPDGGSPAEAGTTVERGGRSPSLLIAAIVVAALLTIAVVLYFVLGGGASEPAAPAPLPVAAPAAPAPTSADGAPADPAESPDPDALVQELVDQAVQDQRNQLEADYQERRRQLEKELSKVEGEGDGGS